MSGKQFLVLLLIFIFYLLLGAAVFQIIEQSREIAQKAKERKEAEEIYNLLAQNFNSNQTSLEYLTDKLAEYCGKPFIIDPDVADPYHWHFYNAVFFVITVVSTIGYGNLAPTCALSRILMIVYGLIGIPINGILLKSLADYFAHFFLRARDKYKRHHVNGMSLAWSILFYFSLGFVVFIICPSGLFAYFEKWTFEEAMYYAFVSLSTIGFGDLVAGQETTTDISYMMYKMFLIVWLVFGLGYLLMVLGFITDAMRSMRMAKLSKGIKQTQSKLWHGFVHEMGYLRRVLNELYLLKVKPVYHDDEVSMVTLQLPERCSSCPDLLWLQGQAGQAGQAAGRWPVGLGQGGRRPSRVALPVGRPRALSEVLPGRLLLRGRSETDLSRIDRRATFADSAPPAESALDPAELLHEFMNALVNWGGVNEDVYSTLAPGTALPTGGYQGFADEEILSTERAHRQARQARQARQRAKSLAPFSAAAAALAEARHAEPAPPRYEEAWDDTEEANQDAATNNAQWTWSGAAASQRVQEMIRARQSRRRSEAVIRKQQRQDRRLQELHDFNRLQELEKMRHLQKRRLRTKSSSAAATGDSGGGGGVFQRPSASGFIQRLGIPQRLKDCARRYSLQPGPPPAQPPPPPHLPPHPPPPAAPYALPPYTKRRSPSCDPAAPPFLSTNPYRTHSVGDNMYQTSSLQPAGRRDSIFRRNSATVHPMLENTSLAEFLRVLQSVQRQGAAGAAPSPVQPDPPDPPDPPTPGKTRKLGTAGLTQQSQPNSIFSLFPGLRDNMKPEKRRLSLRPSSPPAAPPPQPNGKRRMSFWPSFGSDPAGSPATAAAADPDPAPPAPPRRISTARRLSSFFVGGPCTDPVPDQDDSDGVKVTKKRRFSIWPTLGVTSKGGGEGRDSGASTAEDGRAGAAALGSLAPPPQITISYVSDSPPPPPPPREALRRMALISNLPPPPPQPLPGRRGPSTPSPRTTSPVAAPGGYLYRRRALSESTRTKEQAPSDAETFSERL